MADGISLAKEDLYDEKELKKIVSPDLKLQEMTMQEIWTLGKSIIDGIKSYVNIDNATSAGLKSTISGFGETKKSNIKTLFIMGAEYLYKVRQFFLNDTIYFTSGYTYTDEDGVRKLGEHQFNQDEMLKMIRASVSQTAIVLENSLKEAHAAAVSANLSQIWTKVERWASERETAEPAGETLRSDGKGTTQWFQSVDTDINVFFRFKGKTRGVVKYYGGIEGKGFGFNNGWLYEWIKSEEGAETLGFLDEAMEEAQPTPLDPLFKGHKVDAVQGLRGGDYGTTKNGDTVTEQAKYGNKRIISFINILNSIQQVNNTLEKFVHGEITEETAKEFLDIFVDESLINAYSKEANVTVDKLLSFLQKFAK